MGRFSRHVAGTDPRNYQIASLGALFVYGKSVLGLELDWLGSASVLATALLSQLVFTRAYGLPRFDPKSPLISGLSLCLLLRSSAIVWLLAAAVVTIGMKFVVRVRGKHLFNPTNGGIALMLLLTDRVWVSSGQWGSTALFGFALFCFGRLVVQRAARSDVTYAFLAFYGSGILLRSLWLGDPWSIPWHQLQDGALLIFAFFMISDPKTTPDSRGGRILFALVVAGLAHLLRFHLYWTDSLIWALVLCSAAVPALDFLAPGARYQWSERTTPLRAPARQGV